MRPISGRPESPKDGPIGGLAVVASAEASGWGGVRCALVAGREPAAHRHRAEEHVVAFHLRGTTKVELTRGSRFTRFFAEPGGLAVLPAGVEYVVRVDRPVEVLLWSIAPEALGAIARDERGASSIELVEAIDRRDPEFWCLGKRLAGLLRAPREGARLYAEALSTQIALHLLWTCSARGERDDGAGGPLGDARLRQVVDYIGVSLGGEVTLGELAEVSGLSAGYFVGAFKRALGKTPHQYLTERRVARACELLEDPHRAIVDVALEVGFSSQSHLTSVFRKFMKTTPAAYRQEVLGMGGARAGKSG